MRLLIILLFIISSKAYSYEIDCDSIQSHNLAYEENSLDKITEYQRRQLEKKLLLTMTLVLDRLQQKILLEITK